MNSHKEMAKIPNFGFTFTSLSAICGHAVEIGKYANFLKQEFTPGMLVPVDKKGYLMPEPKTCCSGRECGCMGMPYNYSSQEELDEYFEARSKIIFDGFHAEQDEDDLIIYYSKDPSLVLTYNSTHDMFSNSLGEDIVVANIEDFERVIDSHCTDVEFYVSLLK